MREGERSFCKNLTVLVFERPSMYDPGMYVWFGDRLKILLLSLVLGTGFACSAVAEELLAVLPLTCSESVDEAIMEEVVRTIHGSVEFSEQYSPVGLDKPEYKLEYKDMVAVDILDINPARYLLGGSVQRFDDTLLLFLELVDVETLAVVKTILESIADIDSISLWELVAPRLVAWLDEPRTITASEVLAVIPVTASPEIDPVFPETVTAVLKKTVFNAETHRLIDMDYRDAALQVQEFSLMDPTPTIKLGEMLSPDYMLTGSLEPSGESMVLSIRLANVETAEYSEPVEATVSPDALTISRLEEITGTLVDELLR